MPAPAPDTIIFYDGWHVNAPTATVYWRANWGDAWTADTRLFCTEVRWSVAPTMPTARLTWLYGDIRPIDPAAGEAAMITAAKRANLKRAYVKIEVATDGDTRTWVGVVELETDQLGGVQDSPTGRQEFEAVGMESMLDSSHILDSIWYDGATNKTDGGPVVFNLDGNGNRTTAKVGSSYLFAQAPTGATWSTTDIVEYLLAKQAPKDETGSTAVKFRIESGGVGYLPTWDTPEVEQEGATTYSIIDRLVNRRRLMTWHLIYHAGSNLMELRSRQINQDDVDLTDGETVAANPKQLALKFDSDPLTQGVVLDSYMDAYDQVVVQGARRRSVGSFTFGDNLEAGWSAGDEVTYETAASGEADYAAKVLDEKRKANDDARTRVALADVFAKFQIPQTWDRQVDDGAGADNPMFPVSTTDLTDHPVYVAQTYIEPTLPLFNGFDYGGTKIADGTVALVAGAEDTDAELTPLVFFRRPDEEETSSGDSGPATYAWVLANYGGRAHGDIPQTDEGTNHTLAADVEVVNRSRTIRIEVDGGRQHDIAFGKFDELSDDPDPPEWTYDGGMIVTCSLTEHRRAEGRSPSDADVALVPRDAVRRKIIRAGDQYRLDYVAPGTVVDIDAAGDLVRSTGGFVNDDTLALLRIATLAASWYTVAHRRLSLATRRNLGNDEAKLGDLVLTISEAGAHLKSINGIISEITATFPLSENGDTEQPPEFRFETWVGEIDPVDIEGLSEQLAAPIISSSVQG